METLKLNSDVKVIKVKDEKKVYIRIMFILPNTLKNLDRYKLKLVNRMLNTSSNNYRTVKDFNNMLDRNYIINYRITTGSFINKKAIMINMVVPKEGIIDEFSYDNTFKILYELIFNPFVEDDHFDKERFEWEKKILLNDLKNEYFSLYEEGYEEINKFIDEDEEHFLRRDTRRKLIEEADEYNTYQYYLDNIKNNDYFTYIYGGIVDEDKIIESFTKYFKQDKKEWNLKIKRDYLYPYKDYKSKIIKTKYQQSAIELCYQVKNINKKDINMMKMLSFFLYSRENNLLFNALRVKNSLVYETYVNFDIIYGLLIIEVLFDKKDLDSIKRIIKEVIDSVRDEKLFNKYKKNLMKSLKYENLSNRDDSLYEVYEYLKKELKYADTFKYIYNSMNKIKYEDMVEFLDRFVLSREILLEGDNDGKNN